MAVAVADSPADTGLAVFISNNADSIPASLLNLVVASLHSMISCSKTGREQISLAVLRVAQLIGGERGGALRRLAANEASARVRAELLGSSTNGRADPAMLASVIEDASHLPRPEALELLGRASRALIAVLGLGQARRALDEVVEIWP